MTKCWAIVRVPFRMVGFAKSGAVFSGPTPWRGRLDSSRGGLSRRLGRCKHATHEASFGNLCSPLWKQKDSAVAGAVGWMMESGLGS